MAAIRLRREAQPTQVGHDNHVVFDECAHQMTPHVARCAEAMQHDDRWTMPADAYVDLGAVGLDLMRLHTGREGVDAILMSVVVHRLLRVRMDRGARSPHRWSAAPLGCNTWIVGSVGGHPPRPGCSLLVGAASYRTTMAE